MPGARLDCCCCRYITPGNWWREWAQPALTAVYAMFGVALEPNRPRRYDLRQLGGEAAPASADHIIVRATVHNRATTASPCQ